jgi:hypothetical protein
MSSRPDKVNRLYRTGKTMTVTDEDEPLKAPNKATIL